MTSDRPPTEPVEPSSSEGSGTSAGEGVSAPPPEPSVEETPAHYQQLGAKPPRTRTSRAFTGLVAGAVVLILLLVFILENTQSVRISFLGAGGHVALGVALLLAAVGGALATGILGAARIAQVRRHTKRVSRSARR